MTDVDRQNAVIELKQFFAAMREWEVEANGISRRMKFEGSDANAAERFMDEKRQKLRQPLREVFDRYCIPEAWLQRADGGSPFWSVPSSYDPEGEVVESVEGDETLLTVRTRQSTRPPYRRLIYLLTKREGEWRLVGDRLEVQRDGSVTPWSL